MNDYWLNIWKSFPISVWSVLLYLSLSWWASRKLPSKSYKRISWLASWADSICILGVVILAFDILWVITYWLKWAPLNPQSYTLLILNIGRNVSTIIISLLLMSANWWNKGYLHFNGEVSVLIGLNVAYICLWFYFAPGIEWTNWVYALENGYGCWPSSWLIAYPIGKSLFSLLWFRMWDS